MKNQGAAELRLPYELTPTDLSGVFISPPLPDNFDPQTASPASLIRHGLLWRRPEQGDDPGLRAAWKRVFSRSWRAEDRIIPEFEPQVGKTHNLRGAQRLADGSFTGGQWTGCVVPGKWTAAIGYWVIPAVRRPFEPQGTEGGWDSSSWVGIDGTFGSNDVLQAGVQQVVDSSGNPSYVAWYEWYAPPQRNSPPYVFQVNIPNFAVSPGQTVYCSVQYINNNTAGQLYFANDATGQHFSITLAPPPGATFSGNCAEWIMEAPDGGEPTSSLPSFAPVTFTSAICCGPNNTTGNPANGDIFNIVGFGTTLTSVVLGTDTVTIDHVGPGPGWQPWFLIHPEIKMRPGATVTALWRSNDTHLDLFATGTDGAVWSAWWEAGPGWQPWFLIHPEVKMQPGATVTGLWRSNDTHLDLFATGTDGAVWSAWWEAGPGWQPWFLIHPEIKMQPGATVTALWRSNDTHLDLFATGTDGAVWSAWWEAGPGWQPWFLIHPEIKMRPGATVTALWRSNDTHLDLFATGTDGAVWSAW